MLQIQFIIFLQVLLIPIGTSVTDAMIVLSTPHADNELHSITVTCTIHPDSTADQCVVMAMADDRVTRIGNEIMRPANYT